MISDPEAIVRIVPFILIMSPISSLASYILLPSTMICIVMTSVDVIVMVASICYWVHPVRGWRRQVDMTMVFVAMILHYYMSALHNPVLLYLSVVLHWSLYIASWVVHMNGFHYAGMFLWLLLHIAAHSMNVCLYYHVSTTHSLPYEKA